MIRNPSSSYEKLWALGTKHAVPPPPADTLPASHVILESLRKRRGAETAEWLNKLTSNTPLGQQQSFTGSQQELSSKNNELSPEDLKRHELIQCLDKLFDQFELYASRFNSTAQGTDLLVTCTRPNMDGQTSDQSNLYSEPEKTSPAEITYEGHLVTRFWAMLLRGSVGTINVFIIPAESLLGFSLHKIDESIYSPLLVIESEWSNNKLAWHIAGTNIAINQLPLLAKELFGDLIRVASGQMSESELFAHPLQQLSLGENLAVGYKLPAPVNAQSTSQSISQSIELPKVPAAPANAAGKISFSLASLTLAEQLLVSMDADINQLFQLGKAALAAEDTATFQKIELLTEKMETLKETLKIAVSEFLRIPSS